MPSDLFPSSDGKKLDSALRGLHATPTAPLPFLSGVVVRSFILEREQGNVIVYNAPGITAARKEILALGPPDRLLLTHWHEAMYGVPELNVPIFVHENDREQTKLPIGGFFSKREKIGDDLEVIPTPGHTAGTTISCGTMAITTCCFPETPSGSKAGNGRLSCLGRATAKLISPAFRIS